MSIHKDDKFIEFIECVCLRPTMFVRSGSFEEVATFLDGYTHGVTQFAPADVRADCLYAFGYWLSDKCEGLKGVPRSLAWFGKIRHLFPDDQEALQAMARLYREFLDDPGRVKRTT